MGADSGDDGLPRIRRSPSGRVPQWAIDEALGKSEGADPWRAPPVSQISARRTANRKKIRGRRWRKRTATVLGIALVVGLYFTPALFERYVLPAALPYLPGAKVPPPGFEAASAPLGIPPASNGSSAYVLQKSPDPGQPFAAYDPCRPVHYVVRPDNAPPGTERLIEQAVSVVSAASGLQFVYDGATAEAPSKTRETFQPDRYGKQWAPVLIAWSTPEESPDLIGKVAGTGGSSYAHIPGEPYVLVAGQVTLDAPGLQEILSRSDGSLLVRAIIMHELAHVLGLDHVDDPTQLMYEENTGQFDFAAGDRAGLALLGTGSCVPRL
ncbi:matrixin family metalloprotease [Pseudarthrobacter sp. IC2-21]|uniref:matrixin family metalloprotease n=1 Tax=Pseudarthrobacter sp. IC2-21 TaxID=3092262 RepID=UPI002A6AACA8|nr:matrixin family metalloprotease [Pseudarthrobacter sp. IC2-21]